MIQIKSPTWHEIWLKKGRAVTIDKNKNQQLIDLIKLDGFDTGGGAMTEQAWLELVGLVHQKINLKKNDNIIEIGCGAGAFLYPFYCEELYNITGIDYSDSLIEIAKKVMPKANLVCAEAKHLPFENTYFDMAISNSVFNYFPDYQYSEQVLMEILRVLKSGGSGALLDLNDLAKKEYAENARRQEMGVEKYNELYKDLHQLYYDKKWLSNLLKKLGVKFQIFDQDIKGYKNSLWRFNIIFEK